MDIIELKKNLIFLVEKYIDNNFKKKELIEIINKNCVHSVKGILVDINESSISFDEDESRLIKEIVFNYV